MRADPSVSEIPVIAVTAVASEAERQQGLRAGFLRYLTKPLNLDDLGEALEAAHA